MLIEDGNGKHQGRQGRLHLGREPHEERVEGGHQPRSKDHRAHQIEGDHQAGHADSQRYPSERPPLGHLFFVVTADPDEKEQEGLGLSDLVQYNGRNGRGPGCRAVRPSRRG